MDTKVDAPILRRLPVGAIELSIREWPGAGQPFLLVHGLASNARTWDAVGRRLSLAGHRVVAVDQRGHGLSDKPDDGYGFASVCGDLKALVENLGLQSPIVAGQSWGGNVVLEFASRYPALTSGVVMVDGGFIDLSASPAATWERISVDLKPPPLAGTPRERLLERFRSFHPDWDDEAIENTMGNYETLADGTIRPWLSLEHHMAILRALWEQKPSELFPTVSAPVLIAIAGHQSQDPERRLRREEQIARAQAGLSRVQVSRFEESAHDIHVHHPEQLATWMLAARAEGFFKS